MANGLGIELIIKVSDKRKRMKAPLIRTVMKMEGMTEGEYQLTQQIIMRKLSEANDEIAALAQLSGGTVTVTDDV